MAIRWSDSHRCIATTNWKGEQYYVDSFRVNRDFLDLMVDGNLLKILEYRTRVYCNIVELVSVMSQT